MFAGFSLPVLVNAENKTCIVHLQYDFYKVKTGLIIGRGKIRIVPVWSKRNILCFKIESDQITSLSYPHLVK